MKPCPFCSEEIQDTAKKCKHCGEWLNQEKESPISNKENNSNNKIKYYNIGGILVGIVLTLILSKMIYNAGENTGLYSNIILTRRLGGDFVIIYIFYLIGYFAGRGSFKKITSTNFFRKIIIGIVIGILVAGFVGLAQIDGYK